jgi:hypothetical protein
LARVVYLTDFLILVRRCVYHPSSEERLLPSFWRRDSCHSSEERLLLSFWRRDSCHSSEERLLPPSEKRLLPPSFTIRLWRRGSCNPLEEELLPPFGEETPAILGGETSATFGGDLVKLYLSYLYLDKRWRPI